MLYRKKRSFKFNTLAILTLGLLKINELTTSIGKIIYN